MKIFAYGSNMCTARLRARVPSARPIGPAVLTGHELRFHKRGWRDGSGKGDAFPVRSHDAAVWGVLFDIDPDGKPALDRAEGLGAGYDERFVHVADRSGSQRLARMYQAAPTAIDPAAVPFAWYLALVLAGAREHRLPDDYIARWIAATPTRADPDLDRAARHRALVPAGSALAPASARP